MRSRAFKLAACASLVGLVACTAIAGLDGDFVDATREEDASRGMEGQPPDGASDAASDGGSDSAPREDACAKSQPLEAGTIDPPNLVSCANATWIFCWDFTADDAAKPNFGWQASDRTATGGTLELWGDAGAANHNLLGATGSSPPADSGSSLSFVDWNTNQGFPERDPIPIAANDTLDLQVSFKLTDTSRYAQLLAFAFNGETYGLSVYPGPCGARIGPIGEDPAAFLDGVVVDPNAWYRGRVRMTFAADGTYETAVSVGGAELSRRRGAFSGGLPDAIAPSLTVGLFRVGATGSSSVFIDDVILTRND